MRPSPNQLVSAIRDVLRDSIAPELKGERAILNLRKVMSVLREVDWDDAAFQLATENDALRELASEGLRWIDAQSGGRAGNADAADLILGFLSTAERPRTYAELAQANVAGRTALAALIEAASRRKSDSAAELRARLARALASLP